MKCPESELIFKYANDEEINEAKKRELRAHIKECASCRKEYESYVAMRYLLINYWDGKIEGCFDTDTLSDYLDGTVNPDIGAQIEEHIAHCEICATELNLIKQMDTAARNMAVKMPKEVDERIYKKLIAEQQNTLSRRYKYAASDKSEMAEIRLRIGVEFDRENPICFGSYSVELYVWDRNSVLLSFKKESQPTAELNGITIEFYLIEQPSKRYAERIQEGRTFIDLQRFGLSVEEYSQIGISILLDKSRVKIHLDKFSVNKEESDSE